MQNVKNFQSFFFVFFCLTALSAENQWQGDLYSDHSQVQKEWYASVIDDVIIQDDDDILDIGCGNGENTSDVGEKLTNGSITGIDISQSMIDFANNKYAKKNVNFVRANALTFKLGKKFNKILSFTTLHWVEDLEKVIKNSLGHLKPGGQIYFVFSSNFDYFPLIKTIKIVCQQNKWKEYFTNYHPGWHDHAKFPFMEVLSKNNFEPNKIITKSKHTIFKNELEFFEWLKPWFPHQHQVPKNMADEFLWNFIEEFSKHDTKDKEKIHWKGYRIIIDATLKTPMP